MKRFLVFSSILIASLASCKKDIATDKGSLSSSRANSHLLRQYQGDPVTITTLEENGTYNYPILPLDSFGSWHNQAMDFVLNKMEDNNSVVADAPSFRSELEGYIEDFMLTKGIIVDIDIDSLMPVNEYTSANLDELITDFSPDAQTIFMTMNDIVGEYCNNNFTDDEYISEIATLINNANQLSNLEESAIVKYTLATARSSAMFWKYNSNRFADVLDDFGTPHTSNRPPWGSIASSDISGAINGGRIGVAGGGAEIFAGALVGAGAMSCIRVITWGVFGN